MTLQSMTGFARESGQDSRFAWTWEGRSVNARGLDIRCRVPGGQEAVEQAVRKAADKLFVRGNVTLGLSVERRDQSGTSYRVNRELLQRVLGLRKELTGQISDVAPSLEGLLAIRGMLESAEDSESDEEVTERQREMTRTGEAMLAGMAGARAAEGALLDGVLRTHLEALGVLVEAATASAAAQPDAIRARLRALVEELMQADPRLSEDRLAQEAALLVGKADVREELDRLRVHISAVGELLDDGKAVGRRLDFLCQELNREANTLCSKSADVDLTRLGLDLKATIEQFREQVQNVE